MPSHLRAFLCSASRDAAPAPACRVPLHAAAAWGVPDALRRVLLLPRSAPTRHLSAMRRYSVAEAGADVTVMDGREIFTGPGAVTEEAAAATLACASELDLAPGQFRVLQDCSKARLARLEKARAHPLMRASPALVCRADARGHLPLQCMGGLVEGLQAPGVAAVPPPHIRASLVVDESNPAYGGHTLNAVPPITPDTPIAIYKCGGTRRICACVYCVLSHAAADCNRAAQGRHQHAGAVE